MARPRKLTKRALHGLDDAAKAVRFLETLRIPEGPKAGEQLRLAPFQKTFVEGALAPQIDIAVLSLARGGAKSAISAGIGLGALIGGIRRARETDGVVVVNCGRDTLMRLLHTTGFDRIVPVTQTLDEAETALFAPPEEDDDD